MLSPARCLLLSALLAACAAPRFVGEAHSVNLDDPVRYHLRYIEAAIRAGRRAEVQDEYAQRLEQRSEDPIAYVLRGYTLEADSAAFDHFTKAIELDPDSYWALVALGEVYDRMEGEERAEEVLTRAVRVRPRFPFAHAALGEVYRKRRQLERAITAYLQAIELDPNSFVAHRGLGRLYLSEGDEAGALPELLLASRMAPHDFELHMEVAGLLDAAGSRADAHGHYRAATELKPSAPQAWYGRARTAREAGLLDDAVPALEKVLELKPYHHLARRDLADLLRERKDFARSATLYRDAVRATPGDVSAHRGLGQAYEGLGKVYEALVAYDEALHVDETDTPSRDGIARLLAALGTTPKRVTGASVEQVFGRARERAGGCFSKLAAARPELAGTLVVQVEIDAAGQAVGVELKEDGLQSPGLSTCVRWTLMKAVFPPQKPLTATFTVELP